MTTQHSLDERFFADEGGGEKAAANNQLTMVGFHIMKRLSRRYSVIPPSTTNSAADTTCIFSKRLWISQCTPICTKEAAIMLCVSYETDYVDRFEA